MSRLPSIAVWGETAYIEVPSMTRTAGPGVHWRAPLRHDRCLTDPAVLLAVLRAAAREAFGSREEVDR